MSLFARNLLKYGRDITLEDRNEKILNGQSSEVFTNPVNVRAIVKTVRGKSVFDDTNTERVATHEVCLTFIAGVTSEKWVKLGSRRIKILTVENICEEDKVLRLMCTERGEDSKVVNQA
jgi:head-tail adaptor